MVELFIVSCLGVIDQGPEAGGSASGFHFPWEMLTAVFTALLVVVTWLLVKETKEAMDRLIEKLLQMQEGFLAGQQRLQTKLLDQQSDALAKQLEQQRRLNSLDAILRFNTDYESTTMRKHRRTVGELLAQGASLYDGQSHVINDSAKQVLDFFETMGLMVQLGVLDKEIAWSEFGPSILHYYRALAEYVIGRYRSDLHDVTRYEQFMNLYMAVRQIEMDKKHLSERTATPTTEDLKKFYVREKSLGIG